jgi:hypothetical protein
MVVLRISLGHTISEKGQSRHFNRAAITSDLPRLADMLGGGRHVSKVSKSDIDSVTIRPLRWQGS